MLLCVHLIKYQSFGASPSAAKVCTGRMIYFYQVFPLLSKCSADATALHFTVTVFCTYTFPHPLFFSWVYSKTVLPLTRTRALCSPAGRCTSAHAPKWGGSKHQRTATLTAIALKSCALEMQIRTLTKRSQPYSPSLLKSEVTPLLCSWEHLRLSHHLPAVSSTSPDLDMVEGWVRRWRRCLRNIPWPFQPGVVCLARRVARERSGVSDWIAEHVVWWGSPGKCCQSGQKWSRQACSLEKHFQRDLPWKANPH